MSVDAKRLSVVSNEIPDPPYPSETKANGWKPEQDIQRIKQSRTWVLCPPPFRPWLLMVWMEAWESVPVGTYPADDDEMIAARIGMDMHEFEIRRKILMRGWYRCSDGNLYHPYLSEMIRKMLSKRAATRERQRAFSERKKAGSDESANALDESANALVSVNNTSLTERNRKQEQEVCMSGKPTTQRQRFVPPTPEDVATYAASKGISLDAHEFIDFYASKGWLVGKSPMKDWTAAARRWARNNATTATVASAKPWRGDV